LEPEHPATPTPADRHLGTRHLRKDVVSRSVRGGVVTIGAQGLKIVLQMGAVVLLARLLAPADFGIFAMIAAFLTVLEMFKDMGLSSATVQREEITSREVSTLFWLNTGLGAAVALVLAASAPLLSWFYGEPVLTRIVPAVALAFLFSGLGTQHLALLRRRMRFSVIAVVQVAGDALALAAAVGTAFAGFGIWALVVQRLVWASVTTLGAWIACGWRPTRPARFSEVRGLVAFGGNAMAAMVVANVAGNLDKVLIGWWWGATPLGFFERAQKLQQLPVVNLNTPLTAVALPALSRLVGEPERYRAMYLAVVERMIVLVVPIGGLFIAAGDLIIRLVLGPQWMEATPILAWMGLGALYMPVTYTLSWLYMSQDRTPEMLRAGLVNSGMTIAVLLAGLPFGPTGVAASYAVSGLVLRAPVLFWLATRRGPVSWRDLAGLMPIPACAVTAATLIVVALRTGGVLDPLPLPAELAVVVAAMGGVMLLVYAAFPHGRRIFFDTERQVRALFPRKAKA